MQKRWQILERRGCILPSELWGIFCLNHTLVLYIITLSFQINVWFHQWKVNNRLRFFSLSNLWFSKEHRCNWTQVSTPSSISDDLWLIESPRSLKIVTELSRIRVVPLYFLPFTYFLLVLLPHWTFCDMSITNRFFLVCLCIFNPSLFHTFLS